MYIRFPRFRSKAGFTLVEIMVGLAILVGFLLPVFGLFMMNTRNTEYSSSWSVALNLAHNVMERIISEDVPFIAIEPEGFPGGTKTSSGRSQMDFRDSFGPFNFGPYSLKSILGADGSGNYKLAENGPNGGADRIIIKHGLSYRVMVWAGIYGDGPCPQDSSTVTAASYKENASPEEEMTFSYYPNPWFDYNNDCAEDNSSGESRSADLRGTSSESICAGNKNRPINPYRQKPGWKADATSPEFNGIDDVGNDLYRHGFPIPGGTNWDRDSSSGNTKALEQDTPDNASVAVLQNGPYFVRYENKCFHNKEDLNSDGKDDGGFMKVVVGIKWTPRGSGGAGLTAKDQEFYLVSFKANLQSRLE